MKRDMKLSDRVYRCSFCGLVMDRDINAAINLKYEGTKLYEKFGARLVKAIKFTGRSKL